MTKIYITFLTLICCLFNTAGFAQRSWKKVKEELIFENPPFKSCHAPTLVETAPGKLMAAWFGGPHEGHKEVSIWMSKLDGNAWDKPMKMTEGIQNDTLRYPCWNPVLFKEQTGKVYLYYKVGPTTRAWWGEYIASDDNGSTWGKQTKMPEGILGPAKNKPVQLKDGTILSPTSNQIGAKWRTWIERSKDHGRSWELIPVDTSTRFDVIQPSILTYKDGQMQVLCRSKQDYIIQGWSVDGGSTWGEMTKTTLYNPNSGTDALTLKSGLQLLVYNPTEQGKKWYNGREKLSVAVSKDGINWKDILVLEDGKEKEDYSYPAVIQGEDGKVHIAYTYNRKSIKYVVLEGR